MKSGELENECNYSGGGSLPLRSNPPPQMLAPQARLRGLRYPPLRVARPPQRPPASITAFICGEHKPDTRGIFRVSGKLKKVLGVFAAGTDAGAFPAWFPCALQTAKRIQRAVKSAAKRRVTDGTALSHFLEFQR